MTTQPALPRRKLGRTGLLVSRLGLGAAELRGPAAYCGPACDEQQARNILHAALDAGINYIDTADDYGLSEQRIGRWLGHRRDDYVLATKCGFDSTRPWVRHTPPRNLSRANLFRNIETSLRRLRTDRVDLLQLHNPSVEEVERLDVVGTLEAIRRRGMARFIGVSTGGRDADAFAAMTAFDVFQLSFSCINPANDQTIRDLHDAGAGVVVRGVMAKGDPTRGGRAARKGGDGPPPPNLWRLAGLETLRGDIPPTAFALRYAISHPGCDTAIVGMLHPAHLRANVAAVMDGPLPATLCHEVTRRVDRAWRTHYLPWREQRWRMRLYIGAGI